MPGRWVDCTRAWPAWARVNRSTPWLCAGRATAASRPSAGHSRVPRTRPTCRGLPSPQHTSTGNKTILLYTVQPGMSASPIFLKRLLILIYRFKLVARFDSVKPAIFQNIMTHWNATRRAEIQIYAHCPEHFPFDLPMKDSWFFTFCSPIRNWLLAFIFFCVLRNKLYFPFCYGAESFCCQQPTALGYFVIAIQ